MPQLCLVLNRFRHRSNLGIKAIPTRHIFRLERLAILFNIPRYFIVILLYAFYTLSTPLSTGLFSGLSEYSL